MIDKTIEECKKNGIDICLGLGDMLVESGYYAEAVSPSDPPCMGYLQLSSKYFPESEWGDPVKNIEVGIRELKKKLIYYKGDLLKAVKAYH